MSARLRRVCVLLACITWAAACAPATQTPIPVQRSLRAATAQLYPIQFEDTIQIRAVVISHESYLAQDRETRELTLQRLGAPEQPIQLRYTLPKGEEIPVQVGESVTVVANRPTAKEGERVFTSLLLTRGQEWLFLLSEQNWIPSSMGQSRFRWVGDGDIAFTESGRIQGLCEAVRQERGLSFEWNERRYNVPPGGTITIPDEGGMTRHFTLVENSTILKAQCPITPESRRSLYMIGEN